MEWETVTLGMGDLKPEKTTRFVSRESRESFGFFFVPSVGRKRKTDIKPFQQSHENSVANCGSVLAITAKCQIIGATTE